jgi:hypothetical protein
MSYSIPRDVFLLLEAEFNNDREKAEVFAKAIEGSILAIENKADERITHKKETLKSELYHELRSELKQNSLLLKVLIGIAVFGLTLFNPAFVKLVELIIK